MSATAPATSTEKKTVKLTAYRILKFPDPPSANASQGISSSVKQGYQDVGGVSAASANAAIKIVAEKSGAGTYVAVPSRSWKTVTVTVETQTVVKLGEAS